MRRLSATLTIAVVTILLSSAAAVSSQASCGFVGGFATLRDLVGPQKVGACVEGERYNDASGNIEQRTTGGLFVLRTADNVAAFTDGGTTWLNGPDGLQSRANADRFAWEAERAAPSQPDPRGGTALPASDGAAPSLNQEPTATPTVTATSSAPAPLAGAPSPDALGSPAAITSAEAGGATPTVTSTPTATTTPTVTATPTPSLKVKFADKPDRIDTGSDAKFVVETNAEKGTCSLVITFQRSDPIGVGADTIDKNGRCEWKFNIHPSYRTGEAKVRVDVTSGTLTSSAEETFDVRKGETVLDGDLRYEIELDDMPDEVGVGEEFRVRVETNQKGRGTCELRIIWPRVAETPFEKQTPDDDGRCSWRVTVPATIDKKGKATIYVTIRRDKNTGFRTVSKEFEVKK